MVKQIGIGHVVFSFRCLFELGFLYYYLHEWEPIQLSSNIKLIQKKTRLDLFVLLVQQIVYFHRKKFYSILLIHLHQLMIGLKYLIQNVMLANRKEYLFNKKPNNFNELSSFHYLIHNQIVPDLLVLSIGRNHSI